MLTLEAGAGGRSSRQGQEAGAGGRRRSGSLDQYKLGRGQAGSGGAPYGYRARPRWSGQTAPQGSMTAQVLQFEVSGGALSVTNESRPFAAWPFPTALI